MPILVMSRFRVLELGAAIAAPFCSALLADAGAEVYKIETERRPDNLRGNWPMFKEEAGLNNSYYYNIVNRNKRGITLDLLNQRGRETFLELVRLSDIVIENFAAGTMDRFDLPYETLRQANPSIVMLSLSGFGATGPAKDNVAYGPLLEAVTGMAGLGGYVGGRPMHSPFVFTDYCSAMYGANLILAALQRRLATGQGAHFDLAQVEVGLNVIPDAVLTAAVNGVEPLKRENRDEFATVHGVYPCRGHDTWVAIAARTDKEWEGLTAAMGRPAWSRRAAFRTLPARASNQGELDRHIAAWTRRRTREEAVDRLQRHGVAAGPVNTIKEAVEDPHLNERGALQPNRHPVLGSPIAYASPLNVTGIPRAIRHGAPLWGEHNGLVYKDLLGMDEARVEELGRVE